MSRCIARFSTKNGSQIVVRANINNISMTLVVFKLPAYFERPRSNIDNGSNLEKYFNH